MDEALEPWDVWLCPVAATPTFTHRPFFEDSNPITRFFYRFAANITNN
ncbi:hypothetical protein [Scytonema sp. NUACC26]